MNSPKGSYNTFQDCPCHAHCIDGCNGCNNRICTCDESVLNDDPAYSRSVLISWKIENNQECVCEDSASL